MVINLTHGYQPAIIWNARLVSIFDVICDANDGVLLDVRNMSFCVRHAHIWWNKSNC